VRRDSSESGCKMILEKLTTGPFQSCCYIVAEDEGADAMVIDPGDEGEKIIETIERRRLNPVYIINTHGHSDHIGANGALKERFPQVRIGIHEKESPKLADPILNLSLAAGVKIISPEPDILLKEGDILAPGSLQFEVIEVPGHTVGGIVLLLRYENQKILFAGDTLFEGSIGNTDFPGGNYLELVRNIKKKILTLGDDTRILPGHGAETTVAKEKKNNVFLQ